MSCRARPLFRGAQRGGNRLLIPAAGSLDLMAHPFGLGHAQTGRGSAEVPGNPRMDAPPFGRADALVEQFADERMVELVPPGWPGNQHSAGHQCVEGLLHLRFGCLMQLRQQRKIVQVDTAEHGNQPRQFASVRVLGEHLVQQGFAPGEHGRHVIDQVGVLLFKANRPGGHEGVEGLTHQQGVSPGAF